METCALVGANRKEGKSSVLQGHADARVGSRSCAEHEYSVLDYMGVESNHQGIRASRKKISEINM